MGLTVSKVILVQCVKEGPQNMDQDLVGLATRNTSIMHRLPNPDHFLHKTSFSKGGGGSAPDLAVLACITEKPCEYCI